MVTIFLFFFENNEQVLLIFILICLFRFSFRENSEDKQQQKKKNRKRKKSKSTSRATDRGQTESEEVIIISDSPDHHLLDPSGQSEAKESKVEEIAKLNRADAEVWDRLAVAKEGPRASNTLPTAKGRISSSSKEIKIQGAAGLPVSPPRSFPFLSVCFLFFRVCMCFSEC